MLVNLAILKDKKKLESLWDSSFDLLLGGLGELDVVDPLPALEVRPGSVNLVLLLHVLTNAHDAEVDDSTDEGEVQGGSDLLKRSHNVSLGRGVIIILVICAIWQKMRHLVIIAKDLDGL
jgi:hypothetical protein